MTAENNLHFMVCLHIYLSRLVIFFLVLELACSVIVQMKGNNLCLHLEIPSNITPSGIMQYVNLLKVNGFSKQLCDRNIQFGHHLFPH